MIRRAAATECGTCWAQTLTGVDADTAALRAVVDNWPLTRTGELLAVVAGRATYSLDLTGALHRRDRWSIRRQPRQPVYAEHRCHQPLPLAWCAPAPTPVAVTACEGMPF